MLDPVRLKASETRETFVVLYKCLFLNIEVETAPNVSRVAPLQGDMCSQVLNSSLLTADVNEANKQGVCDCHSVCTLTLTWRAVIQYPSV